MSIPELPLLDETRCTNCSDCVFVCPVGCLEAGVPVPWLPRPHDCVSCSLCALICPVDAIRMGPIEPEDEDGVAQSDD
jgi:formate hydrogenlyase subunit 6/NADH:ubiquinone oxidoreductase subunit I